MGRETVRYRPGNRDGTTGSVPTEDHYEMFGDQTDDGTNASEGPR